LCVVAGDTLREPFIMETDTLTPVPIDFTGCTARSTVRSADGTVVATGIVTFGGVLGTIVLFYPTSSFAEISASITHDWDLEITYTNGDVVTEMGGTIDVLVGSSRGVVPPVVASILRQTFSPQTYDQNADGMPVDLLTYDANGYAIVAFGPFGGGTTLTTKLQESNNNITFVDMAGGAFPVGMVASTTYRLRFTRTRRYVRMTLTISGSADLSAMIGVGAP